MSNNTNINGKKFLNSSKGIEFARNLRRDNPSGYTKTIILEKNSKGQYEKVGEKTIHINEIIHQEEKR